MTQLSAAERRWWSLFKRIIKAMPPSLELMVHQSTIEVCKAGSREKAFTEHGDADNTPSLDFVKSGRIYPCSESL